MFFTIEIKETNDVVKSKILRALRPEVNHFFKSRSTKIKREIQILTKSLLEISPEMGSLRGGQLQGAFGIPSGTESAIVTNIINTISEAVVVKFVGISISGGKLRGGFKIEIQPTDFSNLLGLGGAVVTTKKGASLPWLQWLLTLGDALIIGEYHFESVRGGRSGLGLMFPRGAFRVPPSYSGTSDNNFITRAFVGRDADFANAIENALR